MKNVFLALESGSMEQQRKKKSVAYAIIITAVALMISLSVFLISGLVSLFGGKSEKPNKDNNSLFETTTTVFEGSQKDNGSLLLLDDNHPYRGTSEIILIRDAKDRPKTDGGPYVYTIGGTPYLGATTETISAFNQMMADFYAHPSSGKDDNIYIDKACNITSASQSELFASGLCLALTYYENYNVDSSIRPSIYGVEKYKWIYDNAHKYGFIQLYPATTEDGSTADANIFRYVGIPHATYIKQNKISFEEYLTALSATTPSNPISINTVDGNKYIYYIPADGEHVIPKNNTYSISGDNKGGYIITVNADVSI